MIQLAKHRTQYANAQQAMIASEAVIKDLRRSLSIYVRGISPDLEACLPAAKGPNRLTIGMPHDNPRSGAAYQPFAVQVKGIKAWHVPDTKEVRALNRIMKAHGWMNGGLEQNVTHWWITYC